MAYMLHGDVAGDLVIVTNAAGRGYQRLLMADAVAGRVPCSGSSPPRSPCPADSS